MRFLLYNRVIITSPKSTFIAVRDVRLITLDWETKLTSEQHLPYVHVRWLYVNNNNYYYCYTESQFYLIFALFVNSSHVENEMNRNENKYCPYCVPATTHNII